MSDQQRTQTAEPRPAWEWLATAAILGMLLIGLGAVLIVKSASGAGLFGLLLTSAGGMCLLFCVITGAVNLGIRMSRESGSGQPNKS